MQSILSQISFEQTLFIDHRTEIIQIDIAVLRAVDEPSWFLGGTQEGVGQVSLCDIPGFMSQHDLAHRIEIEAWMKSAIQ